MYVSMYYIVQNKNEHLIQTIQNVYIYIYCSHFFEFELFIRSNDAQSSVFFF